MSYYKLELLDRRGKVLCTYEDVCWASVRRNSYPYVDSCVKLRTTCIRSDFLKNLEKFSQEDIRKYVDLLTEFYPGYTFRKKDIAENIFKNKAFNINLLYPNIVGFGSGTILRFLMEKPSTVKAYLWLLEKLPKIQKWKLYLLAHGAAFTQETHGGHSLIPCYGQNAYIRSTLSPKKVLEQYFSDSEENNKPAIYQKSFTGMLNNYYEKLILRYEFSANRVTDEKSLLKKALVLLGEDIQNEVS